MKADRSAYSFRAASSEDLPRLRRWLNAPEVRRWWGNPGEQFKLLRADLNEPLMTMRIVSLGGRPFAYAQDYHVHAWPQPHFAHLPKGSRAIDSFIGWPSMIGAGHGQAYLRLLAERLCAEGAPLVAIDPAEVNLRARRAYAGAGFRIQKMVVTEDGPAVLMVFQLSRGGRLALVVAPSPVRVLTCPRTASAKLYPCPRSRTPGFEAWCFSCAPHRRRQRRPS